ncbi:MAG: hypothetical protein ACRC1W_01510 [Shewanella sp.]
MSAYNEAGKPVSIIDHIAHALHAMAWCDQFEENQGSFKPRSQIDHLCGPATLAAQFAAHRLIGQIEVLNNANIYTIVERCRKAYKLPSDGKSFESHLGWGIVFSSLGANGDFLSELDGYELKTPLFEFAYDDFWPREEEE